jgi:hypothetical protein
MADQRDLHDIEQVVPATFGHDNPRWSVFEGALRRGESRNQQDPVWESMDLGGC